MRWLCASPEGEAPLRLPPEDTIVPLRRRARDARSGWSVVGDAAGAACAPLAPSGVTFGLRRPEARFFFRLAGTALELALVFLRAPDFFFARTTPLAALSLARSALASSYQGFRSSGVMACHEAYTSGLERGKAVESTACPLVSLRPHSGAAAQARM